MVLLVSREVYALKVRVKYSKHDYMKYIGHLDMMRYFQKAIRRAKLPIAYSEGFSPHMIMSFAAPLGIGLESDAEYMDISLVDGASISSSDAIDALNKQMVDAVHILEFVQLSETAQNSMSIVGSADYEIYLSQNILTDDDIKRFLSRESIISTREGKKGPVEYDMKTMIHKLELIDGHIFAKISQGSVANLKPQALMTELLEFCGCSDAKVVRIIRKEIYSDTGMRLSEYGVENFELRI